MNQFRFRLHILLVLFFASKLICAQYHTDPFQNRVIAKYYSHQELVYMQDNVPEKFKRVKYYFIYSFSVTPFECSTCGNSDITLVDVKEFESYRSADRAISINDTLRGFTITLLSQRQFDLLLLNTSSPTQVGIKSGVNIKNHFDRNHRAPLSPFKHQQNKNFLIEKYFPFKSAPIHLTNYVNK